jgi:hypothetical protein
MLNVVAGPGHYRNGGGPDNDAGGFITYAATQIQLHPPVISYPARPCVPRHAATSPLKPETARLRLITD